MESLIGLTVLLFVPIFTNGSFDQLQLCPSLHSEGSIVTKQDTTLKGHVRQSLAKVTFIQCGLRCQRHQWCISINFQITTGQCELNDYGVKDETSAEGKEFEKRQGFVYSQLRPEKYGCHENSCHNGGTCKLDCAGVKPRCICPSGYQGQKCEDDINECSSNPCQNGGSCSDQVNGYNCTCVTGYTGANCQTNIDECSSNPCQNGGTCSDQINGYNCTCVAGHTGMNCETYIDECSSSPCQNGGTCKDNLNSYTCACLVGFSGVNCETNIDECSSNPCQNGGTCSDQVNGYNCTCVAGYTGANCQTNIDECASNPCQNGGSCSDQVNGYSCTCVADYIGANCETCTEKASDLHWPTENTTNLVRASWLTSTGISSFTLSIWLKVPSTFGKELVPFSYATSTQTEALKINIKPDRTAEIKIMGNPSLQKIGFIRDGTWQHICITWNRNDDGNVFFYINGINVNNVNKISEDSSIGKGGTLIIGQSQTTYGGGFDIDRLMFGHMTGLNIWSRVFSGEEVKALSQNCTSQDGDVVAWSTVLANTLEGDLKKICSSSCPK